MKRSRPKRRAAAEGRGVQLSGESEAVRAAFTERSVGSESRRTSKPNTPHGAEDADGAISGDHQQNAFHAVEPVYRRISPTTVNSGIHGVSSENFSVAGNKSGAIGDVEGDRDARCDSNATEATMECVANDSAENVANQEVDVNLNLVQTATPPALTPCPNLAPTTTPYTASVDPYAQASLPLPDSAYHPLASHATGGPLPAAYPFQFNPSDPFGHGQASYNYPHHDPYRGAAPFSAQFASVANYEASFPLVGTHPIAPHYFGYRRPISGASMHALTTPLEEPFHPYPRYDAGQDPSLWNFRFPPRACRSERDLMDFSSSSASSSLHNFHPNYPPVVRSSSSSTLGDFFPGSFWGGERGRFHAALLDRGDQEFQDGRPRSRHATGDITVTNPRVSEDQERSAGDANNNASPNDINNDPDNNDTNNNDPNNDTTDDQLIIDVDDSAVVTAKDGNNHPSASADIDLIDITDDCDDGDDIYKHEEPFRPIEKPVGGDDGSDQPNVEAQPMRVEEDLEGGKSRQNGQNAVLDSLWSGKWKRKETLQLKSNTDRGVSAVRSSGASSPTSKSKGKVITSKSARASPSPPVEADRRPKPQPQPQPQPPPLMATAFVDDRQNDDPFGLKSIHRAKSPDEDGAGMSVVRQAARGGRGAATATAKGSLMGINRGGTRGSRGTFIEYELPPRFRRPRIAQEQASVYVPSSSRVESTSPFSVASEGPDIQEIIAVAGTMMLLSAVYCHIFYYYWFRAMEKRFVFLVPDTQLCKRLCPSVSMSWKMGG